MRSTAAPRPPHRTRAVFTVAVLGILLIAGVVIVAAWFASRGSDGGQAALERARVDPATLSVTVPIRSVAGHVVVDVKLGADGEAVPLILDTGAPVLLADAVTERYGGEAAGRLGTVAIDGGVVEREVVSLDRVEIGGAIFEDVGAMVGFVAPDNPLSCISPNGLLGATLMHDAVWQIDYSAGVLTIAASVEGLEHIAGATRLDFRPDTSLSPSPVVSFEAGDGSLAFLLDTGSDGGLSVNPADLEAVGESVAADGPAYRVRAAGAAGTYDARVAYEVLDLTLGDRELSGYPMATLGSLAPGKGNIGNAFLEDFVVTIDWPNRHVYLDEIEMPPRPPVPAAITIGWDGERIIAGSVVEGSSAASLGLEVGTPIAAIDGRDVSSASRHEFCELLVAGLPETWQLTTDDGSAHTVESVEGFFEVD